LDIAFLPRAAPRCSSLRLVKHKQKQQQKRALRWAVLLRAASCCAALLRCFVLLRPSCALSVPGWAPSNSGLWHDATYDVLENRGIVPVADWAGECCFAAVQEVWLQQVQVKGSSWGQQLEGKTKQEQDDIWQRFLQQCGAKLTSRGLSRFPCMIRPLQRLRAPFVGSSSVKECRRSSGRH
jgi:hypothetical protein